MINELDCFYIIMPNLSYFMNEIPRLVNMQINHLSITRGAQISGMEPEAISLLQVYRWTYNLDQLKRIITNAFYNTHSPYIIASTITDILRKETALYGHPLSESGVNIDLPLKDIEYNTVENTEPG